ncbi:esterase-like activity of phytase family protein [Pseudolabrys sp. FHR47]|uniref:esterase-like activity of phytase family protein n=1 Tax=Pseudolabrys sp. FHR47 TaxID=2562284 RepID=UPI0010BF63F7|nr:esterase-like activity of phytase family protein [Pseudolabrys sp. FHR47]
MRYVSRRIVVVVVALAAIGTFALAQNLRYADAPEKVEIRALPIVSFDNRDPTRVRFGALEFRGGLELTSKASVFGGLSGLVMSDNDHLIAVTDNGSWLKARLVYRDGRLDGLADAEMAPLIGENGKPLAAQGAYDAESLTRIGGDYFVGFERVERIVRFAYGRDDLNARGEDIRVPGDFKSFKKNASLECLASPPAGQPHAGKLIAITERSLDAAGNHRAFVLDPTGPFPGEVATGSPSGNATKQKHGDSGVVRFTLKRSDDFDVTDCTYLASGDLLVLERRFSPARGAAMRIRKLPLSAIREGAVLDSPTLIEADLGYQIDNMEGIAVTQNAAGETIVTLVSDDNFSAVQRNLILQFALVE